MKKNLTRSNCFTGAIPLFVLGILLNSEAEAKQTMCVFDLLGAGGDEHVGRHPCGGVAPVLPESQVAVGAGAVARAGVSVLLRSGEGCQSLRGHRASAGEEVGGRAGACVAV